MQQLSLFAPDAPRSVREHYAPDRPSHRLATNVAALSTAEIVAVICWGTPTPDNLDVANALLRTHGGLLGIQRSSVAQLATFAGMTAPAAARLLAALDVGRRAQVEHIVATKVTVPEDVAPLFQAAIGAKNQEHLAVVCLDNKGKVSAAGVQVVYVGTVDQIPLRCSEVFRPAILGNSPMVIVAHNHPSQSCAPSAADIDSTRALVAAGKVLDIECRDHLVVSATTYLSLRRHDHRLFC